MVSPITMYQRIVGVVGSRASTKEQQEHIDILVGQLISSLDVKTTLVVSGGSSSGADYSAKLICGQRKFPYVEAVAFWNPIYKYSGPRKLGEYDRLAGFRRNTIIASLCTDLVAFWDGTSKGTTDTITKARGLGKHVEVVRIDRIHPIDQMVLPKAPPSIL